MGLFNEGKKKMTPNAEKAALGWHSECTGCSAPSCALSYLLTRVEKGESLGKAREKTLQVVWVSKGCCNKIPKIGWFLKAEMYCVTVLEPGSLKSVSVGLGGSEGVSALGLSPGPGADQPALLVFLACSCLCLSFHGVLGCLSASLLFSTEEHCLRWIQAHLEDLTLAWLHLQRPAFQIRSRSQVWGARVSLDLSKGHNSSHHRRTRILTGTFSVLKNFLTPDYYLLNSKIPVGSFPFCIDF